MKNNAQIQGILSVAALLCLVVGWFNLFSPEINDFLYQKLFYILIGISFYVQAPLLSQQKFVLPMKIAAAFCVFGALLPSSLGLDFLKTAGLLAGVVISLIGRPRLQRNP